MIFLIKLKPLFFAVGLVLELFGGAGLVYSFKVQKVISFNTSLFQSDINALHVGLFALFSGILFHVIFFIIKNYAQGLEKDLFESKHIHFSRPVPQKRVLKSQPAQFPSNQTVSNYSTGNHWPSEKQAFTRNAQPQYDFQQQQRFQRTHQHAAQQTFSSQNQPLHPHASSSSVTVKPTPSQNKGVYNAYYVPQSKTSGKVKDFDALLDDENEFSGTRKGLIIKVVICVLLLFLIGFGISLVVTSFGSTENSSDQISNTNTNSYQSNAERRAAVTEPVSDKMVFTSEPSGANIVSIRSNRIIGITPFTIKNPPLNRTISLSFQKSGFKDYDIKITYTGGVLNEHAVLTMAGQ